MATTAHTIYSRYNPKKREVADTAEGDEEWASTAPKRHLGAAPTFVPASGSWSSNIASGSSGLTSEKGKVSDWYRSLTSSVLGPTPTPVVSDISSHDVAQSSSSSAIGSSSSPSPPPATITTTIETSTFKSPLPSPSAPNLVASRPPITEKTTKNNWFIMNAIRSGSTSSGATPPPVPPPPPSLADMIARDPPPQPSEAPFKPPVFLALGPANKGWAMLQQRGWREGEGLGLRASQKYAYISSSSSSLPAPGKGGKHNSDNQNVVKHEDVYVTLDDEQDICERRCVEVIDLTELSDEDEDVDGNGDETMDDLAATASSPSTSAVKRSPQPSSQEQLNLPLDKQIEQHDPYEPTALLTPIATVLKSDRLGIGLKAKTVGPYKASQKRITHNDRALAAHIRTQEQLRKQQKTDGRGARGFARRHKREEESRRELIAYLNR